MPIKQLTNNLIRDITKVGFMPKSEARRRIYEIIDLTCKDMLVEEKTNFETDEWIENGEIHTDRFKLMRNAKKEAFNQCCAIGKENEKKIKKGLQ